MASQDHRTTQAYIQSICSQDIIRFLKQTHHQSIVDAAISPHALHQRTRCTDNHSTFSNDLCDHTGQTSAQFNARIAYFHQHLSTTCHHHAACAWCFNGSTKQATLLCHQRAFCQTVALFDPDQFICCDSRNTKCACHIQQHMLTRKIRFCNNICWVHALIHTCIYLAQDRQKAFAHNGC